MPIVCSAQVRALRVEHSAHVHAAERRPERQAVHAVHDDHLLGHGGQTVQPGAPTRHPSRAQHTPTPTPTALSNPKPYLQLIREYNTVQ